MTATQDTARLTAAAIRALMRSLRRLYAKLAVAADALDRASGQGVPF